MFIFFINILNSLFKVVCVVLLIVGIYQKNTNATCRSRKRLDRKVAIVTGGCNGVGLEIAKDLAHRGAKVIIADNIEDLGRRAKELIIKSSGNVSFKLLDLSSFTSITKFATDIKKDEDRLDILINNASVDDGDNNLTENGINFTMQVNYFAPVLLIQSLLPLLKKSGKIDDPSRIVNRTSKIQLIGKIDFAGWKKPEQSWSRYASSKLCMALHTPELAKMIQNFDVVVNVIDPGITGSMFENLGRLIAFVVSICFKTDWEGAQTAVFAAVSDDARVNGKYFSNCRVAAKETLPFSYDDEEKCQVLWKKTMDVLKVEEIDDI